MPLQRNTRHFVPLTLAILFVCVLLVWKYSDINTEYFSGKVYNQISVVSGPVSNAVNRDKNAAGIQTLAEGSRKSALSAQPFTPMTLDVKKDPNEDAAGVLESLNNEKARQDDPRLVKAIRESFIFPPSTEPYNLDNPNRLEYSNGQTPFVDSRLNYVESGFYVECGALNGEKGSNTLFFEKVRKWNGILIEADPGNFQALQSKHRKAFTINACLNPYTYPARMQFNKAYNRGRVIHDKNSLQWIREKDIKLQSVSMQCFPLYSILLALNQTRVDYFSLDIEGDELGVLKTIPWDKVDIRMLSVEYVHETGKGRDLQKYMESKGYDTLLKMQRDDGGVNDLIFRRKGLTH